MRTRILLLATALSGLAAASSANAAVVVVDFNSNANNVYFQSPLTSNGFTATSNVENAMGTNVAIDGSGQSNGTVHLDVWTNSGSDSAFTLTQSNGNAFGLSTFDFATGYTNGGDKASTLTLIGYLVGGGTVTQSYSIAQATFTTYSVSNAFANVTGVRFDALGTQNRAAYDNITVQSTPAVPEPATWAMMLLGFGAIGYAVRRDRKVAVAFS